MRTNWKIVPDVVNLDYVIRNEKARGKKIVFTNGCFDIFHAGHVHYLERARTYGDVLIVGLNNDASVRRIKGNTRPIIPVEQRTIVLAGLACVSYVIVFEEDTPYSLIMQIKPNVLVKGGDWEPKNIIGADIVKGNGGEVHIVDFEVSQSTSEIIARILNVHKESV